MGWSYLFKGSRTGDDSGAPFRHLCGKLRSSGLRLLNHDDVRLGHYLRTNQGFFLLTSRYAQVHVSVKFTY